IWTAGAQPFVTSARRRKLQEWVDLPPEGGSYRSGRLQACAPDAYRRLAILRVFRAFAAGDDVAIREEDGLQRDTPVRCSPQQKFEAHPEVLEFLALRVEHDRPRARISFERDPLLVPADRLGFLCQRSNHSREGSRLRVEFGGRLVVLVESHNLSLSNELHRGSWRSYVSATDGPRTQSDRASIPSPNCRSWHS